MPSQTKQSKPKGKECVVCYEITKHRVDRCRHVLCEECMNEILKTNNKCPICRGEMCKQLFNYEDGYETDDEIYVDYTTRTRWSREEYIEEIRDEYTDLVRTLDRTRKKYDRLIEKKACEHRIGRKKDKMKQMINTLSKYKRLINEPELIQFEEDESSTDFSDTDWDSDDD